MKSNLLKRILALGLSGAMMFSVAACSSDDAAQTGSSSQASETKTETPAGETAPENNGEVPTLTLYPRDANLMSGLAGGYKGEFFASRGFNLEVWAYSDEKTNAILASGDLPDIMYIPTKDVDTMIESGMLLNLDEYLDDMPHVQSYEGLDTAINYVREYRSAGTGSVYVMPLVVGDNASRYQLTDPTERNAVKLHWDAYVAAGCPEITDMYSLLDATQAMLDAMPAAEDGNPMFGTVLNAGSDTSYWACMVMWYRMQGYHERELPYLLELDMVNGTVSSILSKDSMYYKGLKWYNEAYKRGLIDPDSISNDRATQKPKVDNAYTITPSGYLPGWAPNYLPYYVPGTKIHYNYNNAYGDSNYVIGINANTENVEACLKFIDMLADPDAYLWVRSGPEGEVWEADENNVATFTEKGMEASADSNGYVMESGEEITLWNTPWIVSDGGALTSYTDPEGNPRTCMTTTWTEKLEQSVSSDKYKSWQEVTGHEDWKEWLNSEKAYVSESELDNISPFESIPDDMMQLNIDAIKDFVTTASWKMVYAEDDAAFEAIWDKMVADCEGLDAQSIIDWRLADIENAKQIRDSLE